MASQKTIVSASGAAKETRLPAPALWVTMWARDSHFVDEVSPYASPVSKATSNRSLGSATVSMTRNTTSVRSLCMSFPSCSSLDDAETDSCSSKSFGVKNTFIHLDKSCVDSDDFPVLPPRSVSVPSVRSHDYSPCDMSVKQGAETFFETSEQPLKSKAARTRKVTFQLKPIVFDDESKDDLTALQMCGDPNITGPSHVISYDVRNTFIHVKKPSDEDSDLDLPARSVSMPVIVAPELSPVAFRAKSCSVLCANDTGSIVGEAGSIAPASRGELSVGAAMHGTGQCKPCAWFWKPDSCNRGADCGHCHLCPEGELYRRRRQRRAAIRAEKTRSNSD